MKKAVILMVMVLVSSLALAQASEKSHGKRSMKEFTPEQLATLQSKKLTLALDLSSTQQKQIKELLTTRAKKRKAMMVKQKERKGSDTKLTAKEKFEIKNERLDSQIAYKQEVKEILTDEQYKKWEKINHQRKNKGNVHNKRNQRQGK